MRRLIAFILVFVLFLAFIVLNLGNTSDVSLGFRTFKEIPVFLTAFLSFVLGLFFSLPFFLGRKRKKPSKDQLQDPSSAKTKKRRGAKDKNKLPELEEIKKEDNSYGID